MNQIIHLRDKLAYCESASFLMVEQCAYLYVVSFSFVSVGHLYGVHVYSCVPIVYCASIGTSLDVG